MRLTTAERDFVQQTPIAFGESGWWGETIDLSHDQMFRARDIAGAGLFLDYTPLPSETATMDDWAAVWPSLAADGRSWDRLQRRTHHLLWLSARYHRRFG